MNQTPAHGPCASCGSCHDGRCGETNAIVIPSAGLHCPLYVPPFTQEQEKEAQAIIDDACDRDPVFARRWYAACRRQNAETQSLSSPTAVHRPRISSPATPPAGEVPTGGDRPYHAATRGKR